MIEVSTPWVLSWGFRPQVAKGNGAGRWMRKSDEAESATANALSAPVASLGEGKGNGKIVWQSMIYT
ncbi:UNVERIFIED_CONTAM: hypothetical protein Slati_2409900 [Sesamum latifolium]|uniref:Uncharacterized protein n=1 Tax=Sesamum latifolium TaxID=2727402 RepID=A0AAW2WC14_9LAMI